MILIFCFVIRLLPKIILPGMHNAIVKFFLDLFAELRQLHKTLKKNSKTWLQKHGALDDLKINSNERALLWPRHRICFNREIRLTTTLGFEN
jgi:hypothetical protein